MPLPMAGVENLAASPWSVWSAHAGHGDMHFSCLKLGAVRDCARQGGLANAGMMDFRKIVQRFSGVAFSPLRINTLKKQRNAWDLALHCGIC